MPEFLDQEAQIRFLTDEADRMLRAREEEYVQALMSRYEEFVQRITADAQALRINVMEHYGLSEPNISAYERFRGDWRIAKALEDEIRRLNGYANTEFLDDMRRMYQNSYNANAWTLDETTPPDLDINYKLPPEYEIRQFVSSPWQGAMFSQRIGVINDAMARDIQSAVADAMLQGDSSDSLAKRLRSVIGDGSTEYSARAKTIARTELMRAASLGRNAILEENDDIIETWIWVTRALGPGSEVCDDCWERSGKTYDEVEEIAAEQDMEVEPPIHPNCRCAWMPSVKSWKDLAPKDWTASPELQKRLDAMDKRSMFWLNPDEGSDAGGAIVKIEPMKYTEWKDEYLTNQEQGDL